MNVIFAAGDGNRGVQTVAYNLPNDERVVREKGTKRVMLRLDDGPSISGVVLSRRGPLLVLGDVLVHVGTEPTSADGACVIERRRVVWMQVA